MVSNVVLQACQCRTLIMNWVRYDFSTAFETGLTLINARIIFVGNVINIMKVRMRISLKWKTVGREGSRVKLSGMNSLIFSFYQTKSSEVKCELLNKKHTRDAHMLVNLEMGTRNQTLSKVIGVLHEYFFFHSYLSYWNSFKSEIGLICESIWDNVPYMCIN